MSMMENTLDRFCVSQGWTSKNKTVKHFLIRRIDNCRSLECKLSEVIFRNFPIMVGFLAFFFGGSKSCEFQVFTNLMFCGFFTTIYSLKASDMTWRHDLIWLGGLKQQLCTGLATPIACCSAGNLGFFSGVQRWVFSWNGPPVIEKAETSFLHKVHFVEFAEYFCSKLRVNICFWFLFPEETSSKRRIRNKNAAGSLLETFPDVFLSFLAAIFKLPRFALEFLGPNFGCRGSWSFKNCETQLVAWVVGTGPSVWWIPKLNPNSVKSWQIKNTPPNIPPKMVRNPHPPKKTVWIPPNGLWETSHPHSFSWRI